MPAPELERRTLVLLVRPPDPPQLSEEEADALQERHLAFLQRMRDAGHLLAAGPFGNQPDESLRGLCLYRTTLAETRRLTAQDPSVARGRLAVQSMDWFCRAGELPA
jgi:uncharacterized protein YciI